ncbi:hypothetical protein Cgig2_033057 [Carnegiea gigantea]|uniref:Trichome birefringence-like C-terminal domain-containing protein n=1 Tax=Carnegiea gigantea TaxID=171969 RepID=A0A9Q1QDF2_9CARY|nr:hypothetical protein Cgig2_033057 [Carnegiea gigantea]
MDKQRSFSWKPTRFLVLSLSLSFSFVLLSFFSFWAVRSPSVIHHQSFLLLNTPSLSVTLNPLNLQSLTSPFTDSSAYSVNTTNLTDTHFTKPHNSSAAVVDEVNGEDFSDLRANFSVGGVKDSSLADANLRKPYNSPRFVNSSISKGYELPRKGNIEEFHKANGSGLVESSNSKEEEFHREGNAGEVGKGYQCTVEFYVTHFLVHETKARIGRKRKETLRIDSIDKGSSRWRGADILIFNTGNWWSHFKTKAGVNYYQEGKQVYPHLDALTAYRKALTTWATWVDRHVNRLRTHVFFRSTAPAHFRGGQWNTGGHCREAQKPLDEMHIDHPEKDLITLEVIRKMKTPVIFLNVTGLSSYRIDGHPSKYGKSPGKRGSSAEDCSHWCLPGVPDAWNELIYHQLLLKQRRSAQVC